MSCVQAALLAAFRLFLICFHFFGKLIAGGFGFGDEQWRPWSMLAVEQGKARTVESLLKANADHNAKDPVSMYIHTDTFIHHTYVRTYIHAYILSCRGGVCTFM